MTYNVFGGTLSLTQSVSRSDHFFTVFLHHCYTCPILDNICPSSPWFARFPVCTDTSFPACTQVHMQWMPGGEVSFGNIHEGERAILIPLVLTNDGSLVGRLIEVTCPVVCRCLTAVGRRCYAALLQYGSCMGRAGDYVQL